MTLSSHRTELTSGWTLRAVGGSGWADVPAAVRDAVVPATVPGCVHTDLLAAGLIPDPYLADHEHHLGWIGRVDWRYTTIFDWQPAAETVTELVCDGLDTVARIECNGTLLAETRNMHRGYRFDLRPALRPGANELAITFTSALDHAEAMAAELGARPHVNPFPFNMIRKMAANFGWDWGPALVTAGVWRPVAIDEWSVARLTSVRPLVTVSEDGVGHAELHVALARADDPDHGCTHVWDVWNARDYIDYRAQLPRFVAEFGFCGSPTLRTFRRALPGQRLTPQSPAVQDRIRADDGPRKLRDRLAEHLTPPAEFTDWHWATQLNQARAVALGVQHFRAHQPRCAGTILWQLNDCWPVISWSVVDGDGLRKPAWYALRDSYAEHLVTLQPRAGHPAIVAVNDTDQPWAAELLVRRLGFDGVELARTTITATVPPRGVRDAPLPADLTTPVDPTRELLVADGGHCRATWFFAPDLDQHLPPAEHLTSASRVPGGYQLRVTARTLLRDLTLLADQLAADAAVDTALHTVLPGEIVTFTVRTTADLSPDALVAVLRTANQLSSGTPA